MEYSPAIPEELISACSNELLTGEYMLDHSINWLQPYDWDGVEPLEINQDFDGETQTKQGLLVGAIRICNTGCEGYHLYVYRGKHSGEIWSDQRIPFGRLTKISDVLSEYLETVRRIGREHVKHWEQFR